MIYSFHKLIGTLVLPLTLALLGALTGAACRVLGRRRAANTLFALSAAVAYLGSIEPVGNALLAPLEHRYPPVNVDERLADVRAIVVLGSSYNPRDGLPITAALDGDGLVRIVEAVRLERLMPAAQLVVSGGAADGAAPVARGYSRLARELGVGQASIVVLDGALDTKAEADSLRMQLGGRRFILVTSAYHMWRAMRLLERLGLHPIPAPTGQQVDDAVRVSWRSFVPNSGALRRSEEAVHEYVGLAAVALGLE